MADASLMKLAAALGVEPARSVATSSPTGASQARAAGYTPSPGLPTGRVAPGS